MLIMNIYAYLRATLFLYDFLRLMIMIAVFAVLGPLEAGGVFPYTVYIVPNALFPLMTCFLYIRPLLYKSYADLYIAGKIIAVVSSIGWLIFSLNEISENIFTSIVLREPIVIIGGATLIIAAADIVSIFSGFMLYKRKAKQLEQKQNSYSVE